MGSKLGRVVGSYLGNAGSWDGSQDAAVSIFYQAVVQLAILVLPILIVFLLIGLASNIMQIGFVFSGEPIIPKFSKIDPIKGFKNKFLSIKSLEQFTKTIIILIVIAWVAYRAVKREIPVYPPLIDSDLGVILLTYFRSAMHLLWDFLWIFVIVAVADYTFLKWQYKKDLMMTKQEVKEEMKQTEGNTQI